jgi:GntR family transcriptional repressor for pyruvate dehydrogenase complex
MARTTLENPGDDAVEGDGFGAQVERPERLSDKVAEAMLATILRRGLRPGDPLPSERELGEQYGVSRTVIREAVRALGARGVVNAHAGRGLTVAAVGPDAVSTSIRLYLHGREQLPYTQVHEIRSLLEIEIAGLAAERGTDEEIAELLALCEQMKAAGDDAELHPRLDVEFHRALARMTHNELYLILLDSIGDILLEVRRTTYPLPHDVSKAYTHHRRIARKVKARDPNGAREAMRLHLEDALEDWQALGASVHVPAGDPPGGS